MWEPASAAEERVSPKSARNLALGILIGALAGLAFVLAGLRERRPSRPATRPAKPTPAPAPETQVVVPAPVSHPAAANGPFTRPPVAEWTVAEVERLLAEHGDAFPEQREELEIYLDSFRSVAGADGRLPGDVDLVIEDVFAPLIDRAR